MRIDPLIPRIALVAALALALVSVVGCNRKTQLMPAGSDSTGAAEPSMIQLRDAQSLWESGTSEEAASKTAEALWAQIKGLPPTEWKSRADQLLDSLGIGYESADAACALIVNFFARSDPTSGSWPYLFVCKRKVQSLEGRNLRLIGLMTRGLADEERAPGQSPGAAALFGRRSGGGQQPVLLVWGIQPKTGSWDLVQTLGPDSLGGTGTGEFETPADTTIELVTRTYRTPAFFQECATCPHFYKIHRFRWGASGFARSEPDILVPSPYATFVLFIQALTINDRDMASSLVGDDYNIDKAMRWDWGKPRGEWRVAPTAAERPDQIVFFRGDREAYKVYFRPRGDGFEIDGFEETSRTVE